MKVAHLTHAIRVQRLVIVLTLVGLLGLSDLIVAVTAHILGYFHPILVRTLVLFLGLLASMGLDLGLLYHRHELHDQFDKHLVLPLVIFALCFRLSHFSCLCSWPNILVAIHLCHLDYVLLDLLQQEVIGCVRDAHLKKGRNLGYNRLRNLRELGLLLRQRTGLCLRLLIPLVYGEQELIINYCLILGQIWTRLKLVRIIEILPLKVTGSENKWVRALLQQGTALVVHRKISRLRVLLIIHDLKWLLLDFWNCVRLLDVATEIWILRRHILLFVLFPQDARVKVLRSWDLACQLGGHNW